MAKWRATNNDGKVPLYNISQDTRIDEISMSIENKQTDRNKNKQYIYAKYRVNNVITKTIRPFNRIDVVYKKQYKKDYTMKV